MAKTPRETETTEDGTPMRETPTTLDVNSAGDALQGLMADDLSKMLGEATEDATSQGDEDVESVEESQDVEEVEPEGQEVEEPEAETEDIDADAEEVEEAEEETSDDPDSETFTVKVDGEELEVTLDEALSGYQRREAFTRKTQELAEERQTLQQQAQNLAETRAEYAQKLQTVEQVVEGQAQEPDWEELRQQDPNKYAEIRAAWDRRQEQIEAVKQERERVQQELQQQQQQQREQILQNQRERLLAKVPEWTDPDTREAEQAEMVEAAQVHYGFEPEEVGSVLDHRVMLVLRDAAKFRQLQDKGEKAKKTAKKNRKKSRTLKPGSSSKKDTDKVSASRKRLAQSGSVDDAAAALLDMGVF